MAYFLRNFFLIFYAWYSYLVFDNSFFISARHFYTRDTRNIHYVVEEYIAAKTVEQELFIYLVSVRTQDQHIRRATAVTVGLPNLS